ISDCQCNATSSRHTRLDIDQVAHQCGRTGRITYYRLQAAPRCRIPARLAPPPLPIPHLPTSAMSLDAKLAAMINTIPECVAGGYVDIGSGMLLSVRTVDSHPQEVIALVAAATADLFAGQNITMIEK